mmetsp:Transcript_75228/g.121452  ORF Transcript_75228/g.121452 Transcript_75228/m.121452 type:complete len:272 (+) Transcript_75228:424-1239(+)
MIDRCLKGDLRRSEGIVVRNEHVQSENASLKRRVRRAFDQHTPKVDAVLGREDVNPLPRVQPNGSRSLGHLLQLQEHPLERGCTERRRLPRGSSHGGHVHNRLAGKGLRQERRALDSRHLGDALLCERAEVDGRPLLKGRLLLASPPCTERHHPLRFQQLEAFAQAVDLVALAASGAHNPSQICVGGVSHNNCIHHGSNSVDCLECRLGRHPRVVLTVCEHQDAKVYRGVCLEALLQHLSGLRNSRVDRSLASLLHVVYDPLELVQAGGEV